MWTRTWERILYLIMTPRIILGKSHHSQDRERTFYTKAAILTLFAITSPKSGSLFLF